MEQSGIKEGDLVKVPEHEDADKYGTSGTVMVIVPPYCKVRLTYRSWGGRVKTKKLVFRLDEVTPVK